MTILVNQRQRIVRCSECSLMKVKRLQVGEPGQSVSSHLLENHNKVLRGYGTNFSSLLYQIRKIRKFRSETSRLRILHRSCVAFWLIPKLDVLLRSTSRQKVKVRT